MNYVISGKVLH